MRAHEVRWLLMGGQACIVYGAAEFSRDADVAVLADRENLRRLGRAMGELDAEVIAVTTLELRPTPDDESLEVDVLALSDLVAAKKTQCDKDWPMIRRLMEASWAGRSS